MISVPPGLGIEPGVQLNLKVPPARPVSQQHTQKEHDVASVASSSSEADPSPSSSVEEQISRALRGGDHHRVIVLLEAEPAPNARMLNMGLTAKLALGDDVAAVAFWMLDRCARASVQPSVSMYNNVLAAMSTRGSPAAVLAWAGRMESNSVQLDLIATNIKLKALGALDKLDEALAALRAAPVTDSASYNTLIAAAFAASRDDLAEDLLQEMLTKGMQATPHTYTSAVNSAARAGRVADASRWYARMLQDGLRPDTWTLNALFLAHANVADATGALAVMCAAARGEGGHPLPDRVSYNTLITACARAKCPKEAEAAFAEMEERGIAPDQSSYSSVLLAHSRTGDAARAQYWFDRMVANGIEPDAIAFNTLLSAHVSSPAKANSVLHRMAAAGVAASPTSHAIVIQALCAAGDTNAAEATLQALSATGTQLTASAYNSILGAYAKSGNAPAAEAVVHSMEAAHILPTLVTYNSLASAYAQAGSDVAAVEKVIDRATAAGHTLDRFSYAPLLRVCARARSSGNQRLINLGTERGRVHVMNLLKSGIRMDENLRSACLKTVGRDGLSALEKQCAVQQSRAARAATRSAVAAEKAEKATASSMGTAWGKAPKPAAGIAKKRGVVQTPSLALPMTRSSSGVSMTKVASKVLGIPLRKTRSQSASMSNLSDGGVVSGVRLTRSVTAELDKLTQMSLSSLTD